MDMEEKDKWIWMRKRNEREREISLGVAWEVGGVREKDLTWIWKRNGKGRESDLTCTIFTCSISNYFFSKWLKWLSFFSMCGLQKSGFCSCKMEYGSNGLEFGLVC
jgi:hypothetical protein